MKLNETKINIGGMFRCCYETLRMLDNEVEYYDGQVIDCEYEPKGNKNLILIAGTWHWNDKEK